MCTVIKLEDRDKPLIAKKDMKVYKFGQFISSSEFLSVFQDYTYIIEKLYSTIIRFDKNAYLVSDTMELDYRNSFFSDTIIYATIGFHSFATLKRLKKSNGLLSRNKIGLFIIPKGAIYYRNGCDNVVSNQIIFKYFI